MDNERLILSNNGCDLLEKIEYKKALENIAEGWDNCLEEAACGSQDRYGGYAMCEAARAALEKGKEINKYRRSETQPNGRQIEILPPGVTLHMIAETIARNCVAWDTSKDKRTGLLPEVYITDMGLYKRLTGEEYTQYGACRKFNIGE